MVWDKSTDTGSGITNYRIFTNGRLAATVNWSLTNWTAGPTIREGAHTWRVKAVDRIGFTNVSLTWTFTVDRSSPSAPVLSSPSSNATAGINTPLFVWQRSSDGVSGISNYLIQISSNSFAGTQRSFTTQDAATTNWTASPKLSDGPWTWRVFSMDKARNFSLPGPARPFQIDTIFSLSLRKTVYITNGPAYTALGGDVHHFVPGALCVYTITYTNLSVAGGTNVVLRDSVPTNLLYLPNTVLLDGVPQTDTFDGDRTDYNITLPNTVTSTLKSVPGRSRGTLVFRVLVK
jgi:uncharacterized repeat protein (TIGR01451 family)